MDKKFKDTKVGQFIKKAGQIVPDVLDLGLELATGGGIRGAAEKIQEALGKKAEFNADANKLLLEWEEKKLDFQRELIAMENADRADARARNVAYVNAGKTDWLQIIAAAVALGLLCAVVYLGLTRQIEDREIYMHVLGIIEGVAISIFQYTFGSSVGSKQKQKKIDEYLQK